MGGLWKKIPITFAVLACAWVAIAGVPPFSGFQSKDAILLAAHHHHPHESPFVMWGPLAVLAALSLGGGLYFNVPKYLEPVIPLAEEGVPRRNRIRLVGNDQYGVEGNRVCIGFPGYHVDFAFLIILTENPLACYTRADQIFKKGGATHVLQQDHCWYQRFHSFRDRACSPLGYFFCIQNSHGVPVAVFIFLTPALFFCERGNGENHV